MKGKHESRQNIFLSSHAAAATAATYTHVCLTWIENNGHPNTPTIGIVTSPAWFAVFTLERSSNSELRFADLH